MLDVIAFTPPRLEAEVKRTMCDGRSFSFTSVETLGVAPVCVLVEATVAIFEAFLLADAGIAAAYSVTCCNRSTACGKIALLRVHSCVFML